MELIRIGSLLFGWDFKMQKLWNGIGI